MLFLGFATFLLFLGAVPFAGAVCLKLRPERLFAAGLLLNGLVFYFACAANLCDAGFYAILAANLALYVPALAKLRRDPGAIREFATPPTAVFGILLTVGFLLATREHLVLWDEYSHWGTSARLLFRHGVLNCAQGDLLKHASYPPGLPVLDILVHKCFFGVGFCDFLPRFAVRTLTLCLFLVPFGDAPGKRTALQSAVGLPGLAVIASFLFLAGVWSCESDCVLGTVFAAAVYAVMRHDRSVRDDLFVALLLAWLFLIKKAGMGFAVMTQILYVVRWIADRRSGEAPKRPVWSALVVLAAPFAAQASWSLLLKIHHTPIIFSVGGISPGGIWRFLRYGEPAYCKEIVRLFAGELPKWLAYLFFAMAALVGCRAFAGEHRPRRYGDLFWFVPLAAAVFFVMLLLTYMFIFPEFEGRTLASSERYANGFLIMPYLVAAMLFCSSKLPDSGRRRNAALYAGTAAALLIVLAVRYWWQYRFSGNAIRNWPGRLARIDARYGRILRAPGERFAAVSGDGGGVYGFILKGEFEDRFVREFSLPAKPGDAGRGPTPEELGAQFRSVRHVLLIQPPENLALKYGKLWEVPPDAAEEFALFEVTPEGRLRPVR